jgi:2-dehydropantoate 2-reductase
MGLSDTALQGHDPAAPPWPRVAVLGAGAVGCYFGAMLARAGAPVTLIGRAPHVHAIERDGLRLAGVQVHEQVRLAASADIAAASGAQWVLFCVKSPDTPVAARSLAPQLSSGAVVLSLQNGVDNVEHLRALLPQAVVVPAVVYVAAAMSGPGQLTHTGRGDLVIGASAQQPLPHAQLQNIADTLGLAGIPCRVSDNIDGELWAKLLLNCAYNAISAVGRAEYARIVAVDEVRELMGDAVSEVLAVAQASGVHLPAGDWLATAYRLAGTMPQATSSTAQDIARGKRTEIDHLNGFIAARGRALGVPTPINRAMHALVKLLERAGGPS